VCNLNKRVIKKEEREKNPERKKERKYLFSIQSSKVSIQGYMYMLSWLCFAPSLSPSHRGENKKKQKSAKCFPLLILHYIIPKCASTPFSRQKKKIQMTAV
jgi:hypothetical protein